MDIVAEYKSVITISNNNFTVNPAPSEEEFTRINARLSASELGKYCTDEYPLFTESNE